MSAVLAVCRVEQGPHQLEDSREACGKQEGINEGKLLNSAVRHITQEAAVYKKTKYLT